MFTQRNFLVRLFTFVLIFLILSGFSVQLLAEQQDSKNEEDFFEMPLEELAKEPYIVVSASRQAQQISELSVPVSVITADDIHYSGLTTIPEILRFTPGVDVLQFDRNRSAVGVRGLHDLTSDRTLVLLNGRSALNPIFGGMEWNKLPVLFEDIDRIEVVRGPGGAAWGANAFTGVINIITKKPEKVLGYFGSSTINEFGDSYTHLRWAEKQGKWSWRLSVGYEDRETSDEAGAGDYKSGEPAITSIPSVGFSTFVARDFARNWRFDSEAIYHYSEQTKWTFGAGHSNLNLGDYELIGYFPQRNILTNVTRLFSRIDHNFNDRISAYLQWFGNYDVTHAKVWTDRISTSENDIEGQLNFTIGRKHDISIGGNLRWLRINVDATSAQSADLGTEPTCEKWGGLFVIDRFHYSDRLTLEGQARADWYSGTERDWSARGSVLYSLDEAKEHVIRISAAKAFRAPLAGFRKATMPRVPFMGMYLVNYLPNSNLRNEETWSLEAGYKGKIADGLTLHVDTYYQRFTHLIGSVPTSSTPPIAYRLDGIDGATSYGAECVLAKKTKWGKLSVWYAYNGLRTDQANQSIRAFYPAKNKIGLTSRMNLPQGWIFNTNYSFNDAMKTYGNSSDDVDTFNRLDFTLAKEFAQGKSEFMVGVIDVFNKANDPVFSTGSFTAYDTPGRMFFARVQYKF